MTKVKFEEDTIAAIATGVSGSIAIVRLSGTQSLSILEQVWFGKKKITDYPKRSLQLGDVVDTDGVLIDQCLAVYMPGPHSYTAEDIVEIQCHGGAIIARSILDLLVAKGARHAEPGEFTKRAFINGKMDLTQAEAVADLINAQSEMAVHTANRQLKGQLGRRVDKIYNELYEILSEIEVRMDFVDEELDWRSNERLINDINAAQTAVKTLLAYRKEGEVLRNGIRVSIIGAPNAGKSSLLNLLLGQDRAIVTDIAGTTRDTLEETVHIRGIPLRLIDTAGIRDASDVIEREGIERSYTSIEQAQVVLWVLDSSRSLEEQAIDQSKLEGKNLIVIANKSDLAKGQFTELNAIELSAETSAGFENLLDKIEETVWGQVDHEEPEFAVSSRHCDLLDATLSQLEDAKRIVKGGEFELIAIHIREAIDCLGRLTGRTVHPDILDYIFGQFCIGK